MKNLIVFILIALGALVYSSVFVIYEGQRGIVIEFGKVKRDSDNKTVIYEPGLAFKMPLIQTVKILDARIQTLDGAADRFVTSEKKDLIVDSYVKWRIKDFETYYLKTSGIKSTAEGLLDRKFSNGLRSEIGSRTIAEIVSGERDELMDKALELVQESAIELGIDVVDVRVKKINLPEEVSSYIYDRMRAERNAVAAEHRSQGKEQAEFIKADIDAKITIMIADAERNSRVLRGEGDAEAAKIYADTYNKNPEFYAFIRSLEAYKQSFKNKGDIMLVKPDSDFFQYMKQSDGK
ncbi:protease modulator HflC [Catenovulum maritimum]|uniref:Protein HflC n=1 Tax=Catenovulum maritimum TaxID=1513271 RepID=A0A0J8GSZ6_9ALTE|nr:protease modulator HflC [Catenovulum maritimum]KMT64414.1 protein HflC [Catenovulum maritimum]